MEEERYEDQYFYIIGGIGPETSKTLGNYAIGDSDIGEASTEKLGECKGINIEERASREREGKERDSTEVGWYGIKVQVLHSTRTAKFKYDLACLSK